MELKSSYNRASISFSLFSVFICVIFTTQLIIFKQHDQIQPKFSNVLFLVGFFSEKRYKSLSIFVQQWWPMKYSNFQYQQFICLQDLLKNAYVSIFFPHTLKCKNRLSLRPHQHSRFMRHNLRCELAIWGLPTHFDVHYFSLTYSFDKTSLKLASAL